MREKSKNIKENKKMKLNAGKRRKKEMKEKK